LSACGFAPIDDDVDAARETRRQLGQLMVEEGLLTQEQLAHALAEQARTGRPLGQVLVELGHVSEGAVANALAEQHGGLLKTEYGTSAGLRPALDDRRPKPPVRPKPVALAPAPDAAPAAGTDAAAGGLRVAAQPEAEAPPQSDPFVARNAELEAQVQALLVERNTLVQKLNESRAQLAPSEDQQQFVAELEGQLRAARASRDEVEAARQAAVAQVTELESQLVAASAEGEPL
jgi:hypothetical protein